MFETTSRTEAPMRPFRGFMPHRFGSDVARRAWIGWWEGRKFVKSLAVVQRIDSGGAKLVSERGPRETKTLWLKLDAPGGEWIKGDAWSLESSYGDFEELSMKFRDDIQAVFYGPLMRPVEAVREQVSG